MQRRTGSSDQPTVCSFGQEQLCLPKPAAGRQRQRQRQRRSSSLLTHWRNDQHRGSQQRLPVGACASEKFKQALRCRQARSGGTTAWPAGFAKCRPAPTYDKPAATEQEVGARVDASQPGLGLLPLVLRLVRHRGAPSRRRCRRRWSPRRARGWQAPSACLLLQLGSQPSRAAAPGLPAGAGGGALRVWPALAGGARCRAPTVRSAFLAARWARRRGPPAPGRLLHRPLEGPTPLNL